MAGADVPQKERESRGGKKGRKKKHRINARVDLTPMVDVVMLLITFFMLTTVYTTPQTMEINIPPDESQVEVAESSLLILRVLADSTIWWNMGIERPQAVEFKDLRALLEERLAGNSKLITLVKVEREATFDMMVNVMDELNLARITRFSTAPFTEVDKRVIRKIRGA
jgi:biopolymer transport protein ExbD